MLGFRPISGAPISGRTTAQTASSSDLSPYAAGKPSLASRVVRATGSAWVDLGGAVAASSDLSVYAQGFSRRGNPRVISAAWYDLGAPVSDDLPIRGQALPRPRATPSYSRVWVDLDSAVVVSSDLSVYAQSISQSRSRSTVGLAWVDLATGVAASSDLSVYAQSNSRLKTRQAQSATWVDLDATLAASSDLSVYAQVRAIEYRRLARSLSWVDLDSATAPSSDLSPYAQARTIEAWRRARNSGTVWNSGDDFFPPQDALAVYAQSIIPLVRIARPLGQGTSWVDLLDGIPPVIPPVTGNASGSGGGGAGRRRVSFEEADQIRRRLREIEIKRVKSWKDPRRLERQLQQIYADLYESEYRAELPELAQPVKRAEPLAIFKPDFAPLLKDLAAIRQLLDLYQIFLDDEEAIALLLLS